MYLEAVCKDDKGGIFVADVLMEFFGLSGMDSMPPETLAELIPYLFHFVASVVLVSGVFAAVGKISSVFMDFRRF